MMRIFSKKSPLRGRAEQRDEWGRNLSGIEVCPECRNRHYKKKWHHPQERESIKSTRMVRKICPACKMKKEHTFEGEVIIEDIPEEHKQNLKELIGSFGRRSQEKDPQHRILEFLNNKNEFRITSTDNQMAVRLAKKIKDAFRKVELEISHPGEPAEVSRVRVRFRREENPAIHNDLR